MANVTYLLGAGASYNALPIVNELENHIGNMVGLFDSLWRLDRNDHKYKEININNEPGYREHIITIKSDLEKLRAGCKEHLSIDTYLKMLYLTGNSEYQKMKCTLVLFFQLYDCLHEYLLERNKEFKKSVNVDKRYDAFLASILQNSYDKFPNTINVISWNYDNQFEKAYLKYLEHANTKKTVTELMNIYSKGDSGSSISIGEFGIFKINGTASYFDISGKLMPQISEYSDNTFNKKKKFKIIIEQYIESVSNKKGNIKPAISFAWESVEGIKKMIDAINSATRKTEYLVTIGYSFPFFNRSIDSRILVGMEYLREIYIQDPYAEQIKNSLLAANYMPLEGINIYPDTRQFHLPHELTL